MKKGIVQNWMSSPVVTVTPETRLSDARRTMNAEKIRALPVIKDGKLIGIITRRGLLRTDVSMLVDTPWKKEVDLKDETVGEVMTRNPITIPAGAALPKAARIMMENKIAALPVRESGKEEVTGIITVSDIMRAILEELPALHEDIRVSDYMTREVVLIDADASLLEAHRLMGVGRIRMLPVMKEGKLVGLVTRSDLMSVDPSRFSSFQNQEESLQILTAPIERVMTRELTTILPTASILDVARMLLEKKIHGLPVLNAGGELVGVITETDLFRMVVQKFF